MCVLIITMIVMLAFMIPMMISVGVAIMTAVLLRVAGGDYGVDDNDYGGDVACGGVEDDYIHDGDSDDDDG